MQKLTPDQIQHIEAILLNKYKITYQDTRDEILDHIACEIEERITLGAGYLEASKITYARWNRLLRPSIYTFTKIPNLVVNTLIKKDILNQIILFGLSMITIYSIHLSNLSSDFVLLSIIVLTLIPLFISGISIRCKNKKSSYKLDYYGELLKIISGFSILTLSGFIITTLLFESTFYIPYVNLAFMSCTLFPALWSLYYFHKFQKENTHLSIS